MFMANNKHQKNGPSMTAEAAARIQSAESRLNGGGFDKGSFTSRAQRAATRNNKPPLVSTLPPEVFRRIIEKSRIHP